MSYNKKAIFDEMVDAFTNDDLDILCNHLGIDHEIIERTTKITRIRDIINITERRNRLPVLLSECKNLNPSRNWRLLREERQENREFISRFGLTNSLGDERVETALQIQIHRRVWEALEELKLSGEHLWESASPQNIADFAYRLQVAESIVNMYEDVFEQDHFSALHYLFKKMGDYRVGKEKLLKIKSEKQEEFVRWSLDDGVKNRLQIQLNKNFKQQYESLLLMIQEDFKEDLGKVLLNNA
jgi:hypothetical protein